MPLDSTGKYHMNPHHARAADAQRSKPGTEPQPGPDGMSGGANGGRDLSAGIPTPRMAPPPAKLETPAPSSAAHSSSVMRHPAHESADQMQESMGSMDPQELSELKDRLEQVLQEITDLLGTGAVESQGAHPASVLGGY